MRLSQQSSRRHRRTGQSERGQSLVEFSLILMPLFLILLGIIQFGFIFNTYITMSNAARDAARLGTVYVYDRTSDKTINDYLRNDSIKAQILQSMNGLAQSAPRFTTSTTWVKTTTGTSTTYTNGDLVITYSIPTNSGGDVAVTDSDPRTGQRVTVTATYHQDLIVPLIAALLPKDAGGRMQMTGVVTMVIN